MKNMSVKDLKAIINELPDDMKIVIPIIDEYNANNLSGFRYARTAGIIEDLNEDNTNVLILSSSGGYKIDEQIEDMRGDITIAEVLF